MEFENFEPKIEISDVGLILEKNIRLIFYITNWN